MHTTPRNTDPADRPVLAARERASKRTALRQSKALRQIVGIAVSALALVYLILTVDWSEVGPELANVDLEYLLWGVVLFVVQYAVRTIRWRYLLPQSEQIPGMLLFDALMVGNFLTFVLPLRAGEFARPAVLKVKQRYSFSAALMSCVIERVLDLTAVLVLFAALLLIVRGVPSWAFAGALGLGGVTAALLVFIVIAALTPAGARRVAAFFLPIVPKRFRRIAARVFDDFLAGAAVLRNVSSLVITLVLTAVIWVLAIWQISVLFLSVGLPGSALISTTTLVFISLAIALPSAPGFVGVYQIACVTACSLFGLREANAVAFSIASHLYQYAVICAFGAISIWRLQVPLQKLKSGEAE